MIGSQFFDCAFTCSFENQEVTHQVKQGALIEHALDQGLQLRLGTRVNYPAAVHALPLHEAAVFAADRAGSCRPTIADHFKGVVGEERRDDRVIGEQLVVSFFEVGLLVHRVFQFKNH